MKSFVSGVLVAAAALLTLGVGSAVAQTDHTSTWVPPHDTIVRVTGDAEKGFGIHHYDGTAVYPPTVSEARAECLEHDRRVDRVRCRTEVATWYADLADLKVALRWANRAR